MNNYSISKGLKRVGYPLLALVGLGLSQTAFAAGTASGTDITNTASVGYTVGGSGTLTASSNTDTFKVDSKVNLTMVKNSDDTVVAGDLDQVLAFTLTNTGNATQSYSLATALGTNTAIGMTNVEIYLDVNGDGLLDAGDALYTNGTLTGDIPADGSISLLVVADTPVTATTAGALEDIVLTATSYEVTGTALDQFDATPTATGFNTPVGTTATSASVAVDNTVADNPAVVQVVLADAGTDGQESATGTYTVSSAALTVAKSSLVISDPINGTTNPKAIPGAVVEYTITVSNGAGAATASSVVVTDQPPVNTTWFNNATTGLATLTLPAAAPVTLTDAADADAGTWNGTDLNVTIGTLAAGETATVTFQVTID